MSSRIWTKWYCHTTFPYGIRCWRYWPFVRGIHNFMMTSSNGNIFRRLSTLYEGNLFIHKYYRTSLQTHLKLKSQEISLIHNVHFNSPLHKKGWNDWTTETDVMDERDFAIFEFKMNFGRISYIAQGSWYLLCCHILITWMVPYRFAIVFPRNVCLLHIISRSDAIMFSFKFITWDYSPIKQDRWPMMLCPGRPEMIGHCPKVELVGYWRVVFTITTSSSCH